MRLEQNQGPCVQAWLHGNSLPPAGHTEQNAAVSEYIDSSFAGAARLRRKILSAIGGGVLCLFLGVPGSAWVSQGQSTAQKPATPAHAAAKVAKVHTRPRSRSRRVRSHHRRRSHKHSVHTRTARPVAKIQRVHVVRHRSHHIAAKPAVESLVALVPQLPATPPIPDWPVNDRPAAASVNWNGRELSIDAKNSSLTQILGDVSTATGVKVEGQSGDQRVYGNYGPAPARDVLNELLEGSDYNIVMIGDSGDGTPRELVLSRKVKLTAGVNRPTNSPSASDDDDEDDTEQPEPAEPVRRRPFAAPLQAPPGQLTPQQEQQMRLQQLQRQLQPQTTPAQQQQPNEQ